MKSPPKTGSSGSSTGSKASVSRPSSSGIHKACARPKKAAKVVQSTEEGSPQNKKWQAFVDTACDTRADNETVKSLLFSALEEERSKKEADKLPPTGTGECSEYDVKELMTQIYRDLHNVAEAQYSKYMDGGRRWFGEPDETDLVLDEVSVGVESVISKSFWPRHILQLLILL